MSQLQVSLPIAPTSTLRGFGRAWCALSLLAVLTMVGISALVDGQSQRASQGAATDYGKLPLAFVPNAGQTDESVRYTAQGAGFSFYFTDDKAVLALQKGDRGHALHLRFLGASPSAKLVATHRGEGRVNYLTGSEHHTNLPTYNELVYRGLWPGIDMAFRGQGGQLKYEFHLAPGANPSDIRLAYAGAEGLSLSAGGALLVGTPLGTLRDSKPTTYQRVDGTRTPVDSRYALSGSSYGFALGSYDRSQPLVIDPGLAYSTYLGGSSFEQGGGIVVDSLGASYVAGTTESLNFPTTAGAFDTSANGSSDAFVAKLNASGSSLDYSTYLGGSGSDGDFGQDLGIAIDALGEAYVTGQTLSSDFPTTAGAFDTSYNGNVDAFVAKLNASGSSLDFSSYLGGSGFDQNGGIDVDSTGAAYVTGRTFSSNFPTTAGAFDTSYNSNGDAFVTKLNALGSSLDYSTYLGGFDQEFNTQGDGIAVDAVGAAYVTGSTFSTDFPTTAGAYATSTIGSLDSFVTKLDVAGSSLIYSTYLGGSLAEQTSGIAVDSPGAAYVTGQTSSTDFPTTAGAFDTSANGSIDAFVTKLNTSGSSLDYSSYLGGSDSDFGIDLAVDSGAAYVTGQSFSTDFPFTGDAFDTSANGSSDAFLAKLDASGSSLDYSSYLGGSGSDVGLDLAVDSGAAYVAGGTESSDFPTTAGAFDTSANGGRDAFITKFGPAGPAAPATVTLAPPDAVNNVGTTHTVTATVKDAGNQPVPDITVRFTVVGATTTSGSCTTNTSGQCSFSYQGPDLPGADMIDAYADTDSDNTRDPGEPEAAPATKAWVLPTSTPGQVTGGGQIPNAAANDKIAFGFNAKSDQNGVKGECTLVDPSTDTKVKCLDATTLVKSATHATIFGNAEVNGTATTYRIDVDDLAEPGKNADTFRIQTASGYSVGGTLKSGNIQVH